MGSIIKVDHLSYVYNPGMPNAVTALDDVSFEVEEGDFVGIIGATGSGKSTLITHMNGLNKPTSGLEHPHHPHERPEQAHQRPHHHRWP